MFSLGTTRGKWTTLLSVLHAFKAAHAANAPLRSCLRDCYHAHPDAYADMGLKDLTEAMWRCRTPPHPPPPHHPPDPTQPN